MYMTKIYVEPVAHSIINIIHIECVHIHGTWNQRRFYSGRGVNTYIHIHTYKYLKKNSIDHCTVLLRSYILPGDVICYVAHRSFEIRFVLYSSVPAYFFVLFLFFILLHFGSYSFFFSLTLTLTNSQTYSMRFFSHLVHCYLFRNMCIVFIFIFLSWFSYALFDTSHSLSIDDAAMFWLLQRELTLCSV